MTFKMKEYTEIFLEALQDALQQGLISHQEEFEQYIKNRQDISNFYVMLLSVHAEVFAEVYRQMQLIYDSVNLNKATSEDLDKIGEWVGIPRAKATRAYVDVTLNLTRAQDEDVTIPKGLQCISRNGIGYHTIEDAYFAAGTTTIIVPAYADNPGVSSRIIENSLYKVTTSTPEIEGSLKCYNETSSSGGSEIQSDEEYREYLLNWTKVKQKGNEWAYRNYFANFDGLDGYQLIPRWDGSGTIKIVIDPPSDTLRQQIYDEVQSTVALFDDDVVVMPFTGRTIDIYAKVDVNIDQINPYSETEKEDMERFQCIFAKNEGAVTAPTSGLHFSRELMKRMEIKGIDFAFVTMHCGLGNFREIDVEDLTKHKMDSEEMFVSAEACRIVNQAKDSGHKICAVGTTVQRTIESAVGTDCHLKEFQGWTNKFIFPPSEFSVADSMVANFYLPYSTLLMLTAAYGGYELVMEAYNQALKEGYRFGTYGDAMLILND